MGKGLKYGEGWAMIVYGLCSNEGDSHWSFQGLAGWHTLHGLTIRFRLHMCEVATRPLILWWQNTMARQYLFSLGLGHCHPSQASIATPIQSMTRLSMAIFPGSQYLSSLRLSYFQPWHPSRLGPTPRQVSCLPEMPTQGGFQIVPHNPIDNFLPAEAFL